MPSITTIIPAYNAAQFIRQSVESALAQTHSDNEIIVVDDGSTDKTPKILRGFGDRITVLQQENAGHVKARNRAAQIARGEWLAFLDADDFWESDKLEKQLAIADDSVGLVYTDRRNVGEIGRVAATASQATSLSEGDIFEPLLLGNFVTVSSAMIRKDSFDQLDGFSEILNVCEDWDLWLRFSAAGGYTRVVREPLTHYRWHAASMTNNQIRMCNGRRHVIQCALSLRRAAGLPPMIRRQARAAVWKCSAWYASPTDKVRALAWYTRALIYSPFDADIYRGMLKCCLNKT